jgi:hypothetical protein
MVLGWGAEMGDSRGRSTRHGATEERWEWRGETKLHMQEAHTSCKEHDWGRERGMGACASSLRTPPSTRY